MDILYLVLGFFTFLLLIGINLPIYIVVASAGIYAIYSFGIPATMIPQRIIAGLDIASLSAVLFFILGGEIMNRGGITQRLSTVLILSLRRVRAGLAYVTILVNLIMSGVSGSATADAAATGAVMIPMMKRSGYSASFSAVLVATAGTMGPLIPPSILFIIIGSMCNLSILDLFLGGALPGILIAIGLVIISYIICRKRQVQINDSELAKIKMEIGVINIEVAIEFSLALLMPVLILGGMRYGIFTPTEAGAVLVIYCFCLSFFVYKELSINQIPAIVIDAATMTANILLIVAVASIIGYVAARTDLIEIIAKGIQNGVESKTVFLGCVNAFLFFMGCFMEITTIAIVLAPILIPLGEIYNVNPISMGVILVFNLMVGLITPPVGMNMYITIAIAKVTIIEFSKEALPFIALMIINVLLITYMSDFFILWLPRVLK